MTEIDVPDWVVEVAMEAGEQFASENTVSMYATVRDLRREEMRTSITAALGAWVVPMRIEWSHVREEKVYLPGNSLVAASRHAANLPPPEAEYRHIWQAKLIASTKNNELPPQDLCRITLRQEKPE